MSSGDDNDVLGHSYFIILVVLVAAVRLPAVLYLFQSVFGENSLGCQLQRYQPNWFASG